MRTACCLHKQQRFVLPCFNKFLDDWSNKNYILKNSLIFFSNLDMEHDVHREFKMHIVLK